MQRILSTAIGKYRERNFIGTAYESTDGGLVLEVATTIAKRRRLVRICVHDPLASHGSCRDVSDQDLSMEAHSFPSVNPFFLGIKERYVYALSDPYSLTAKLWKTGSPLFVDCNSTRKGASWLAFWGLASKFHCG